MKTKMQSRNRGTTLVEAAIVLPLLLLLTLGTVHYGWLLINMQRVWNAARQGARVQAVLGAKAGSGEDALKEALKDWRGNIMPGATYKVEPVTISGVSMIEATVQVDTAALVFVNARNLFPYPDTMTAVVRMAKETPLTP
jgi:hypothetical protein